MNQNCAFRTTRKTLLPLLLSLYLLSSCKKSDNLTKPSLPYDTAAVTAVLTPVTKPVTIGVDGYYVSLPSNYNETNESYPVLVFLPGAGQFGNGSTDLNLLLNDGPAKVINEKKMPGTFKSGFRSYAMIMFTPQFKWWPSSSAVNEVIDFVQKHYRVDASRIYLSGLSLGGQLTTEAGANIGSRLAAVAPMAGVDPDYANNSTCQKIAASGLPLWDFHSSNDPQMDVSVAQGFVKKVNSFQPSIPAKITIFPWAAHDAWTQALDPAYKENGMNVYEWMLQYHR